jgi:3-methylcrotonyl-CoA carboxylase alpha subunit
MFHRILIANRGEIACRVIRTARRMGIATVAVHSDADAGALHVRMADRAVRIGPPPALESYLNAAAIIDAARESGADAIHPGYGFLSENPDFVEAVEAAGLVFIGPSAASIRAMGLKDAAKRLMDKAGVPIVPGYHGEAQEVVVLAGKASEIGYPVLIKARAGGGGKGMRLVERPEDFREALASAKREAKSAFGDDRVLVEKYIEKPRHIEVQVFGDRHGNVAHLYERDCSLQRRHQKVVEEAPAPGMTEEVRAAMTDAAVRAARAIDYVGAGTIEFIVDGSGALRPDGFWFMEMNTRLQVEHPVTEMITGIDLVEWQIRVAAGEKLPKLQQEIAMCGHAVETRLYAEDPSRGFLPATGRIFHAAFPEKLRVDAGIEAGDAVEPWYDPMIAKVIAQGADRATAIAMLAEGLDATEIAGCVTNASFLARLLRHPGFNAGEFDTGLIARDLPALVAPEPVPLIAEAAAALCVLGLDRRRQGTDPFDRIGSWALWEAPSHHGELIRNGEVRRFRVQPAAGDAWHVAFDDGEAEIAISALPHNRFLLSSADGAEPASLVRWPGHVTVFLRGIGHVFGVVDAFAAASEGASGDSVSAPMPGIVRVLHVTAGQQLRRGDPLLVLEAMKMEHLLSAPRDCVISAVAVSEREQVAEGRLLVTFVPEEG